MSYERWINKTDFGTVRRYLAAARSPMSHVLFAATRDVLVCAAAVLDSPIRRWASARETQLRWWISSGRIRLGVSDAREASGAAIDMERISDSDSCSVLYLPPVYLVHLPGLDGFRPRAPKASLHGARTDDQTLTLLK